MKGLSTAQHRLAVVIMYEGSTSCKAGQYYYCNEAGLQLQGKPSSCYCSGQGDINDIMVLARSNF